ncbi:MAG: UDP-N-acetylmuramoyl-L-alanyl-D-glutamate--2,6-diaminopimelate ligase, partial [Pseudolysinimonas sp.]
MLRPEHVSPRSLAGFVQEFGVEHRGSVDGLEITGVTLSTGDLRPGDLFVGVKGLKGIHGASYAVQA